MAHQSQLLAFSSCQAFVFYQIHHLVWHHHLAHQQSLPSHHFTTVSLEEWGGGGKYSLVHWKATQLRMDNKEWSEDLDVSVHQRMATGCQCNVAVKRLYMILAYILLSISSWFRVMLVSLRDALWHFLWDSGHQCPVLPETVAAAIRKTSEWWHFSQGENQGSPG